ncbi:type II toxin-antitoxin system MqsA family antitoxin [Paraburkholderia aspalathi]|uniref:type II toxin-antitoxin system MqsA family antitoxin n=1 Tax=Paraburkholderia aspalathi TaxID=1324617 RepID=UPI0038BDDCAF
MTNSIVKRGGVAATAFKRRGAHRVNACPNCGVSDFESVQYSDTVDFRGLELDVTGLAQSRCQACGHLWATAEQEASNARAIRDEYGHQRDKLRQRHGMLAGSEIAKLRRNLGLNQREASVVFGGGPNSFNKYESGEVLQSQSMDKLLRLTDVVGANAVEFLRDPFNEYLIEQIKGMSLHLHSHPQLLASIILHTEQDSQSRTPALAAPNNILEDVFFKVVSKSQRALTSSANVLSKQQFSYIENVSDADACTP